MRKTSAIFFLLLLVFNAVGYRAWFYYAEKKADSKMEASLDRNEYDQNDLVTLRIPLDMPYQLEKSQFERVNGEISFQGKIYKYVKRKVSHGNLILLCIPDVKKTMLKQVKTEYGNYANDIGTSSTNNEPAHSHLQKNYSGSEYEDFLFSLNIPAVLPEKSQINTFCCPGLPESLIVLPGKPPRLSA